jgi:type II secretory pathway pseudopilin PulG
MIPIVPKSRKGISLVEVMVAVLISTIVILGGSFFFVASTNQINLREQYRAASQLAGQKLEELKAGNYDDVTIGELKDSLSLGGLSYSRSTVTEDLGLYKNVVVTVNWGPAGTERNLSLATLIAPK